MYARVFKFRWVLVAMVTAAVIFAAAAVGVASSAPASLQRVNVAYDGGLANAEGLLGLACSADGRYVAFASAASNILQGDTNGRYDIFWRDMVSQETTLVNVTMSGGFGSQGALNYVEMTPDGRHVLFTANDDNLVPGDTNGYPDVFVRDMVSRETTCVSTSSDGTFEDYYPSGDGSLSDDGRYAVFSSMASNLFADDTNSRQDCILKDLQTGVATNVSYTYDGSMGNGHSFYPFISGDGTKVAFLSYSTGMVPGDVSSLGNLFLRDLGTGAIERVDATTDGGESADEVDLIYCDIDYTGQHVAFSSRQRDIVSVPVGFNSQVYVRDTVSDETTVVACTIDGELANDQDTYPRISSDGRWVSFLGMATNLVPNDTNNMQDVFLRDMDSDSMERLNLNVHGEQLDKGALDQALGANATAVAFNTSSTNIFDTYTSPSIGHIYVSVFRSTDTDPPSVTSNAKASYVSAASISITATDGPSGTGVDFIEWRLDSATTQTANAETVKVSAGPGHHTLRFYAQDVAGNASETKQVAFTVAAVPAITITSASKVLSAYGAAYSFAGKLTSGGVGLVGKQVILQAASPGSPYKDTTLRTTTAAGGTFSFGVKPTSKTYYRARLAATVDYAAAISASRYILPRAYVSKPIAPAMMYRTSNRTVYGYLKPRHALGSSPVRIYLYRYVSGTWKSYGYVWAKATNSFSYSKYSRAFKLRYRGKWKLRAYAPADALHAAAWSSGYDYVTVK